MPFAILWPTFALVALIFVVLIVLVCQRFGHVRRHPPDAADLADGAAVRRYFRPVERVSDNLKNLFETPVLYFALVPLLLVTRHADHLQVLLAWIFVVLRCVHAAIHIASRAIPPRTIVYLLACVTLAAMWIGFFVDMLSAASAYDAAIGASAL